MKALTYLLLFCLPVPISAGITLRSADGREAEFAGVLSVTDRGLYVARAPADAPMLVRWEQLDLEHARDAIPALDNAREAAASGEPVVYALGSFSDEGGSARGVAYRVLYEPRSVGYPFLELFFSRKDPRIQRLYDDNYDRYLHERRKAALDLERVAKALFPGNRVTYNVYGHRTSGSGSPSLTPAHALALISDRNFSARHDAVTYLRHIGFFDHVASGLETALQAASPPYEYDLKAMLEAVRSISAGAALEEKSLRVIRRFVRDHGLPG